MKGIKAIEIKQKTLKTMNYVRLESAEQKERKRDHQVHFGGEEFNRLVFSS